MSRKEVLAVYRRILKLARSWEAKDPTQTAQERNYIRTEAREQFQKNKNVTSREEIKTLLENAEKRVAVAQHYNIPYERAPYLPRDAAYGESLAMSTSPRNSSNYMKGGPTYPSKLIESTAADDDRSFLRHYFANSVSAEKYCVPFSRWLADGDCAQRFFGCSLRQQFPVKKTFEKRILKIISEHIDSDSGTWASDRIYEEICDCMVGATDETVFYRTFFDDRREVILVLQERAQQISNGTTGLACWQASCVLADFIRNFVDFNGKNILELGAGCGLAGIAAARFHAPSSVYLTDVNADVLRQLAKNVSLNFGDTQSVKVGELDWADYSLSQLPAVPEVILAADVVYDVDIIPCLCGLLRDLLSGNVERVAYVGCTIRNPETFSAFNQCLLSCGIDIKAEFHHTVSRTDVLERVAKERTTDLPFPTIFPPPSVNVFPSVILELCCSSATGRL